MPPMESQGWLLKILSGMHQGAEIALDFGSYTLGQSEECDLVLSDSSLADQQLTLTISEEGLIIQPSNNDTIFCEGAPHNDTFTPDSFNIINVANINFVIGPEDASWPALKIPDNQPAQTNQQKIENTDTTNNQQFNLDDVASTESKTQENNIVNEAEIPTLTNVATSTKKGITFLQEIEQWINHHFITNRNPVLFSAATISLFFILFLITFSWLWKTSNPAQSNYEITKALLSDAQAVVDTFSIENMKLKVLPNHVVLITGYLDTAETKNKLKKELELDEIPYQFGMFTISAIEKQANELLKSLGYKNLTASRDHKTTGSFILKGYLPKDHDLPQIKHMLRQEIPGLLTIEDQLEYQNTRIKALRTILKNKGLIDRITLLDQHNKVVMKGKLQNISEGYHFKEAVKEFKRLYDEPKLDFAVTLPSADFATLQPSLDVKSISIGKIPFVILQNGEKYLEGARLQNGYILDNINIEYLTLLLGDKRIKYYIGGKQNDS